MRLNPNTDITAERQHCLRFDERWARQEVALAAQRGPGAYGCGERGDGERRVLNGDPLIGGRPLSTELLLRAR